MYSNILIGLLLSGYITTSFAATEVPKTTHGNSLPDVASVSSFDKQTPTAIPYQSTSRKGETEARSQLIHPFSEPVIIAIIFGVMAGVVGIILLLWYGICTLRKRSSINVPPPLPPEADIPLNSVVTENPEE